MINDKRAEAHGIGFYKIEVKVWKELCEMLVKNGAVTADDLKKRSNDSTTVGCRIIEKIRDWAFEYACMVQDTGERQTEKLFKAAENVLSDPTVGNRGRLRKALIKYREAHND